MKQIVLLILLFSTSIYAQSKFVKVNYALKIGFDEGFSNAEALKGYYAMAQGGAEFVNFDFEANNTASYFKLKETIQNDETDFAIAFSEGINSYYTEANTNYRIKYVNGRYGEFRINDTEKTEWKLENETKYIDSYLCYKATSEQIVINSEGTFKHPIVAWYCPAIPFSFGPKGYQGLPGLILELQVRNITWGATKIELSKDDKIIEKPTKGRLVTQEDYNKLMSAPPSFNR